MELQRQQLHGDRPGRAGHPYGVVGVGRDRAGHEGSVPILVLDEVVEHRADDAPAVRVHAPHQVRMLLGDAGSITATRWARPPRRSSTRLRVHLIEIPLRLVEGPLNGAVVRHRGPAHRHVWLDVDVCSSFT
jgi:hypothetical protein